MNVQKRREHQKQGIFNMYWIVAWLNDELITVFWSQSWSDYYILLSFIVFIHSFIVFIHYSLHTIFFSLGQKSESSIVCLCDIHLNEGLHIHEMCFMRSVVMHFDQVLIQHQHLSNCITICNVYNTLNNAEIICHSKCLEHESKIKTCIHF